MAVSPGVTLEPPSDPSFIPKPITQRLFSIAKADEHLTLKVKLKKMMGKKTQPTNKQKTKPDPANQRLAQAFQLHKA